MTLENNCPSLFYGMPFNVYSSVYAPSSNKFSFDILKQFHLGGINTDYI